MSPASIKNRLTIAFAFFLALFVLSSFSNYSMAAITKNQKAKSSALPEAGREQSDEETLVTGTKSRVKKGKPSKPSLNRTTLPKAKAKTNHYGEAIDFPKREIDKYKKLVNVAKIQLATRQLSQVMSVEEAAHYQKLLEDNGGSVSLDRFKKIDSTLPHQTRNGKTIITYETAVLREEQMLPEHKQFRNLMDYYRPTYEEHARQWELEPDSQTIVRLSDMDSINSSRGNPN